jgi:cell division protein ZapA (FtsZ GTPase activity inhibitor)
MASGERKGQPRLVAVKIAGSTFTIKTDASQDHMSRLEQYVNEKIELVQPENRSLPLKSALALAALSIADDYFAAEEDRQKLDRNVRQRLKRILLRVDAALEDEPRE